MEYEIRDQGEDVLMDDSTNPSLTNHDAPSVTKRPSKHSQADHADKRRSQSAELIPEEEEHQLA